MTLNVRVGCDPHSFVKVEGMTCNDWGFTGFCTPQHKKIQFLLPAQSAITLMFCQGKVSPRSLNLSKYHLSFVKLTQTAFVNNWEIHIWVFLVLRSLSEWYLEAILQCCEYWKCSSKWSPIYFLDARFPSKCANSNLISKKLAKKHLNKCLYHLYTITRSWFSGGANLPVGCH